MARRVGLTLTFYYVEVIMIIMIIMIIVIIMIIMIIMIIIIIMIIVMRRVIFFHVEVFGY